MLYSKDHRQDRARPGLRNVCAGRATRCQRRIGITAQMSRESAVFRERLQTGDAREAFAAFAERRKPDFSKLTAG